MQNFDDAKFFGGGYDKEKDHQRLTGQLKAVHDLMIDGNKRTLRQISDATNSPEASVSAALRTLRNQYGFVIAKDRARIDGGTWMYWIAGGGMGEASRTKKKMKPIGDPRLFGEMMRCIYAHANTPYPDADKVDVCVVMEGAALAWIYELSARIRRGENVN